MRNRGKTELDAEFFAELVKLSGSEVAAIVRDDTVRYAEPTGDASEEFDGCGGRLVGDGHGFYPFGELVDCNQEEGVTTR